MLLSVEDLCTWRSRDETPKGTLHLPNRHHSSWGAHVLDGGMRPGWVGVEATP